MCVPEWQASTVNRTLSGEVKQSAGGQIEHFRGGDVIWYHEA